MNREIKFRGLPFEKGWSWQYGYLIKQMYRGKEKFYVGYVQNGAIMGIEVSPDTIGQYTGLKDKNGKEIYEGDILSQGQDLLGVACISMRYGISVKKKTTTWSLINFVLDSDFDTSVLSDVEVVGNTYDNPELMKGGSNEA